MILLLVCDTVGFRDENELEATTFSNSAVTADSACTLRGQGMSSSGRKKPQKRKEVNQQLTKERMPIKGFMKDTLRVCRQGKADQEGKQKWN